VILAELLGDLYAQVLSSAADQMLPVEQVESRLLMLNHAEVMDRVLRAWRFPKDLVGPIVLHHLSAGNIGRQRPARRPRSCGWPWLIDSPTP